MINARYILESVLDEVWGCLPEFRYMTTESGGHRCAVFVEIRSYTLENRLTQLSVEGDESISEIEAADSAAVAAIKKIYAAWKYNIVDYSSVRIKVHTRWQRELLLLLRGSKSAFIQIKGLWHNVADKIQDVYDLITLRRCTSEDGLLGSHLEESIKQFLTLSTTIAGVKIAGDQDVQLASSEILDSPRDDVLNAAWESLVILHLTSLSVLL